MRFQVLVERNMTVENGLGFLPVLSDQKREIDVAHQARYQGGGEKSVEKTTVKNEVPTQAEKRKRQKVSKRFPDDEAGQDQKKEISCYCPMKEDLALEVFVYLCKSSAKS